jgi:hypothetical protein
MRPFARNDIVFLLGAGASIGAKIPHSAQMIGEVEALIGQDKAPWSEYRHLYNFLKSATFYSDGIHGKFDNSINIERLVNTLDELNKRDQHTLYPFIGSWTPKLLEIVGTNFSIVEALKQEIVKKLRFQWIAIKDERDTHYFKGLLRFQQEFEHPLRVFTLNYDLCVEKACGNEQIERGFNENNMWDWRLFDENTQMEKPIYLYKLHGSNDWTYDQNNNLVFFSEAGPIEEAAIIFGTMYKLQYLDPFLFLAYEFRRWTLEAHLIIAIGYGFGDEHINGIIKQALNTRKDRLLLSISPLRNVPAERKQREMDKKRTAIAGLLGVDEKQVRYMDYDAKEFLEHGLCISKLSKLFPDEDESLFPLLSPEPQPIG